jgi:hypothetical protein
MRRTVSQLAAVVALLASLVACGAAAADTEPNEGLAQAEGPLKGGAPYAGVLSTDNDVDWYVFYATSQSQLDISFWHEAGSGWCSAYVELHDADGTEIDTTAPRRDEIGHIKYTTPPGTNRFFLRVDGGLNAKYHFRIDPGAAVVDGPRWDSAIAIAEPNETLAQSSGPLVGGTVYGGSFETDNDEDWVRFHTLGLREVDISVLNTSDDEGSDSLTAILHDRTGNDFAGGSPDRNEIRHLRFTSPSGITPYYLRLVGGTGATWQLRIDPADALTTKPFEPCLEARRAERAARKLYKRYVKRSKTASKRSTRRSYRKKARKQRKKLDAATARVAVDCS